MTWRTVYIANEAKLKKVRNQLEVTQGGDPAFVPIEDIALLVLESHQILLTTAVLDALLQAGAAVLVCDAVHLPSGILLPYFTHHRFSEIVAVQLDIVITKNNVT